MLLHVGDTLVCLTPIEIICVDSFAKRCCISKFLDIYIFIDGTKESLLVAYSVTIHYLIPFPKRIARAHGYVGLNNEPANRLVITSARSILGWLERL